VGLQHAVVALCAALLTAPHGFWRVGDRLETRPAVWLLGLSPLVVRYLATGIATRDGQVMAGPGGVRHRDSALTVVRLVAAVASGGSMVNQRDAARFLAGPASAFGGLRGLLFYYGGVAFASPEDQVSGVEEVGWVGVASGDSIFCSSGRRRPG
jgi:hypothetical protein